jgi:hypothetical protein
VQALDCFDRYSATRRRVRDDTAHARHDTVLKL